MKVYLTAMIKSKPEYSAQVLATLQNMVVHSRKETGCLQYDLHRDTANPHTFIFYEIWENEAILATHNGQPYIKEFVSLIPDKLYEPPTIIKMELL